MPGQPAPDVIAAGAVVTRKGPAGREVLLVHRPAYDDWSFPKGKLDPGEHPTAAAVREVAEETGLTVRLGPGLTTQRYAVARGAKVVHYWVAWAVGEDDVSRYAVNDEIDAVAWVPWADAAERLTYEHDRATLAEAWPLRRRTHALVVLRHASARQRKTWRGDDRRRPLNAVGAREAERLLPVLAAYDVTEVHSSSSVRCVTTVAPYVHATGWPLQTTDDLSEEGESATAIDALVGELLAGRHGAVVCTHRPVLPTVFEALGVDPVRLEPAGLWVAHHRKGRLVAVEQQHPGPVRDR